MYLCRSLEMTQTMYVALRLCVKISQKQWIPLARMQGGSVLGATLGLGQLSACTPLPWCGLPSGGSLSGLVSPQVESHTALRLQRKSKKCRNDLTECEKHFSLVRVSSARERDVLKGHLLSSA